MGEPPHQVGSSSRSVKVAASSTLKSQEQVSDRGPSMTTAPELRVRQNDCSQVSQSASQAVQQVSQQAAQSVQQASQHASQSVQQASQSASQAIQKAQQSASQSIAAASRSASSVSSSASSVVSSVQASAASAISQASLAMQSVQLSASVVESEASKAVLAAQNPQTTESSQLAQPSPTATALTSSHTGSVTGAQLALAVVGSIIASAIITIVTYFLINRYKRMSRAALSTPIGEDSGDVANPEIPVSDEVDTTIAASNLIYPVEKNNPQQSPQSTLSLFPKSFLGDNASEKQNHFVTSTSLSSVSANPPTSPSLQSWLKRQNDVPPFGPIQLPTKQGSKAPLGGQLKSPLRSPANFPSRPPPRFILDLPPDKKISTDVSAMLTPTSKSPSAKNQSMNPKSPNRLPRQPPITQSYLDSKASVWTYSVSEIGSPKEPEEPLSPAQDFKMRIPSPNKPIRNTAEWLLDRTTFRSPSPEQKPSSRTRQSLDDGQNLKQNFGSGLPNKPSGPSSAFRARPKSNTRIKSVQSEVDYVRGGFLDPRRRNMTERSEGEKAQPNTPGVGKAL